MQSTKTNEQTPGTNFPSQIKVETGKWIFKTPEESGCYVVEWKVLSSYVKMIRVVKGFLYKKVYKKVVRIQFIRIPIELSSIKKQNKTTQLQLKVSGAKH